MQPLLIKMVIAVAVAAGLVIAAARSKRQQEPLTSAIVEQLKAGPLTLGALSSALSLGGLSGRGKVVLALQAMAREGKVSTIEAPPGTPQLKKVDFITYQLIPSSTTVPAGT